MKHTREDDKIKKNFDLVDPELIVICKHCGKRIDKVRLIGFSLICPLCGKPQNGQSHTAQNTEYNDLK
jgi:predicted RNA-binding Zn-ribbon protein involved in translation (DUF1610 family)